MCRSGPTNDRHVQCGIESRGVIGVCSVRNEEDVIEAFVRHTLFHLDRLLLVDNGSTDATPLILASLVEEGLPVEVHPDPRVGNWQSEISTSLMRRAVDAGARWVVPLDADEFIVTADGERLRLPDSDEPMHLHWRTYIPSLEDDTSNWSPVHRITTRLETEPVLLPKVVVPAAIARDEDAIIVQGNHGILRRGAMMVTTPCEGAALAHFPIRDVGQYAEKTATRWLKYLVEGGHAAEEQFFDAQLEDKLMRDWDAFVGEFHLGKPAYFPARQDDRLVHDPLDMKGGPLRYSVPPRHLGGVLGRALRLADGAIRQGQRSLRTAEDVPCELAIVGAGSVRIDVPVGFITTVTIPVTATDGPSILEVKSRGARHIVEVRSIRAGRWQWVQGMNGHPRAHVANPGSALIPHPHCLRFVHSVPGGVDQIEIPEALDAGDVDVDIIITADLAAVGAMMLDRTHVWALSEQSNANVGAPLPHY